MLENAFPILKKESKVMAVKFWTSLDLLNKALQHAEG
jgi:hypothetical protein